MISAKNKTPLEIYIEAGKPEGELEGEAFRSFEPLIYYILSKKFPRVPRFIDKDDLMAYGRMGLLVGIRKYDSTRGVKPITYLYKMIISSILTGFNSASPFSELTNSRRKKLEKLEDKFYVDNGRRPIPEEFADNLGISQAEYERYYAPLRFGVTNLGDLLKPEEDEKRSSLLEDYREGNPSDLAEGSEAHTIIDSVRSKQKKRILYLRLFEELSFKEIGERVGLNKKYVNRIFSETIKTLRKRFAS